MLLSQLQTVRFQTCAVLVAILAAVMVPRPASALKFRFPVADPVLIWADMVLHVDHDPAILGQGNMYCLAPDCTTDFPYCYDEHRGTDFILDGGFGTMDQEIAVVVAAAGGTVIEAVDGNYDRCHADLGTQAVTCDGNPIQANYVGIRHADGTTTLYYHLKKGSVAVQMGQVVACGDRLGLVGSSGISSMPHVHFQVEDPSGGILDPYPGPCGTARDWWVVADAGNGLPGPWCEGEAIPAEPAPEALPEAVPEVVAGEELDASIADEAGVPPDAGPVEVLGEGAGVEVPTGADPGADDAFDRADVRGIVPGSGFGCTAGATGTGATVPVLLLLVLLALAIVRREKWGRTPFSPRA